MTTTPQTPTEARSVLPTLEDILSDYRMDEISTATAIDHIQCHIDEARTTPTTREVLEELKTKLSSRMKDLDPEIADIVSKEFWNLLA